MLWSVMQSRDTPWTFSTDSELQYWIWTTRTMLETLHLGVCKWAVHLCTQRCQVLYKPGRGLIFTVTLGTVTVSINPDSQSASRSLSVSPNDINKAVLAVSLEETCLFPQICPHFYMNRVSNELFRLLCGRVCFLCGGPENCMKELFNFTP